MKAFWIILATAAVVLLLMFIIRRKATPSPPDEDQQVLDAMRADGADVEKPTEVLFYLYFPAEASANRAASDIQLDGFTQTVRPSADGKQWLCLLTREMVPNLDTLHALRRRFEALAAAERGEYDGWEAKITR